MRLRTLGLAVVVAGLCADAGDPKVNEELARLQGTWQLVSAESNGVKADEDRVQQFRVTIEGSTHTVRFGERVLARKVPFTIDPTSTPKRTTDTLPEGPNKGKQILGIYLLEGDRLTSCVAPIGEGRPTEFSAAAGTGNTLRVFRRVAAPPPGT